MNRKIELTSDNIKTIVFVGGRYAWSDALLSVTEEEDDGTSTVELDEQGAQDLLKAFLSDTEGGHSMFPMLDNKSELGEKLWAFVWSVELDLYLERQPDIEEYYKRRNTP